MSRGKIVKLLRLKNNISQKDFATKTGISPNYLSLIENGKRNPPISYLEKAANILNVPLNLLLWEKVDYSKFKDNESKQLAKEIDDNLKNIHKLLFGELINS